MTIGNFFGNNKDLEKSFNSDGNSDKQFEEIRNRINPAPKKIDGVAESFFEANKPTIEEKDVALYYTEKMIERNEDALEEAKEMLATLREILAEKRLKPLAERTKKEEEEIQMIFEYGKKLLKTLEMLPIINAELKGQIQERDDKIARKD